MTTQIQIGAIANSAVQSIQGPRITSIYVTDSSYNNLDDTAVDSTSGGYIKIIGTGFASGCIVVVGGLTATSTTFVSSTEVRAQIQAQAAGSYTLYLSNSDGSLAIKAIGVSFSGMPSWSTSTSQTFNSTTVSFQFSASSDSTVVYSLDAGSSLPPGLSLSSGGLLSGTFTGTAGTVYTFVLQATDSENQNTPRTFGVTISATEPYFYITSLLVHADGSNNATNNTFLDSSSNALTITRNGSATQGTFSPFSQTGWSYYNNGTASTYVTVPYTTANFDWWTTDYTIDVWIYPQDLTNWSKNTVGSYVPNVVGNMDPSTAAITNYWSFGIDDAGHARLYYYNGGYNTVTSTATVNLNQWNHIGMVKTSSGVSILVNGVATSPTAVSGTPQSTATVLSIGSYNGTAVNGYISNLRIVKGTAVYSGTSYTVPTSSLTAITNTKLLTMQSNRFVDNSTNALTHTITLSPTIQAFSPFAPGTDYVAATHGGSLYCLSGNSDYLTVGTSGAQLSALGLGTGAFTIEFWIYPISGPGTWNALVDINLYTGGILMRYQGGSDSLYILGTAYDWAPTTNLKLYTWSHVALSRNGSGAFRLYINGTSVLSGTNAGNLGSTGYMAINSAQHAAGQYMTAYYSNFRIVKGSAVYDPTVSTLTVPTTLNTAISGTSFLLNGTNASIYDQAARNDIVTVSTAKLSTTQYKFGTSSIVFNGSSDGLTVPASQNFVFGTGDFTIEFWMRSSSSATSMNLLWMTSSWAIIAYSNSNIYWQTAQGASSLVYASYGSLMDGNWHHIAATRASNAFKLYIDGTQTLSATDSTNYTTNNQINIGSNGSYGWFNGYMDEIRITKGYARYTSAFTPSTTAFKDQ